MAQPSLVLVSNRGPVTFGPEGEIRRGSGGLVTALIGLASYREVTWVASAMTEQDVLAAEHNDGKPFVVHTPGGGDYRVKLVASDPDAYDRFYNIIANPMLWFIQHYLWDLSNAPDIRRHETEAFEFGYNAVNEDLARAVVDEIEEIERPVVMIHDYHLYTLPGLIRRARPDAFLTHFVHIPWSQSDSWRVLPSAIREDLYHGILANDIIGFHTSSYRRNFLQCCEDLLGLEVEHDAGIVHLEGREVWVRAYPLPIDPEAVKGVAGRERTERFEDELLRRRRDHLILRVDRADLSKNVLRGFSAFDVFLEQHPEFRERVTFIAQLMPSRTDVPEYAEYLERIEANVAVVNHRHGSPDWMPIQLKLRDDLEEAVAAYKHYDVLMVNAMFDGMNLVAKEGPIVNEQRRRLDPVGEHRRPRGARRVRAVGQPVRHSGAGRLDPRGADDVAGGAQPPPRGVEVDHHLAQSGGLDRRAARRHQPQGRWALVEGLAVEQHLDVHRDPLGPRLGLLDVVQPVQECVPVVSPQRGEELGGGGAGVERGLEVGRDRGPALGLIGVVQATVRPRGLELAQARGPHPLGIDQLQGRGPVDLRPLAARAAGREPLQEVDVVEAAALPVDPAEADRLLERLGVVERLRGRALLGDLQPGAARGVVVCLQPALPGRLVGELDDREVVLWHLASQRTQRARIRRGAAPGGSTEHPL